MVGLAILIFVLGAVCGAAIILACVLIWLYRHARGSTLADIERAQEQENKEV